MKACRIRGAPRNEAIAEDSVAAITPASMRGPKAEILLRIELSPIRSADEAFPAMRIATDTYTMVDSPTAANVPRGRLRPASFRSPDMLTPWVNPVTAGKKMAKTVQNPRPPGGAPLLERAPALLFGAVELGEARFTEPPLKLDSITCHGGLRQVPDYTA